ncbi:uncharacterized protein [Chelonus insularis]|uniref:uncharacterized protein isoform X1 n=1 Tax=Chelonus insularis TaxID=460826 RepID=UPI0015888AF2|nr:uncharacterized protein LOC118070375 isoform X1 [Chelonus insularis]
MGENKSIYKHFSALPLQPNQKLKSYSCNYCKKKYAENITRMRKHLYKECRSCPQDLRKLLKPCKPRKRNNSHLNSTDDSFTIEDLNEADNRASTSMISNENLPNNISVCSNNYKKNTIDSFCDKMSKKDEDSLQELLAEAIYASGTPLCITENPYWLKFFNALRPSFNLPSRNQISNNLLDSVFVRTQNMVNEKIESATTVGVQCDAWSNIRKEGIINFIVTTPAPVFFKTFPTGTESQTALYISEKIGSVIDALGIKKVIGICKVLKDLTDYVSESSMWSYDYVKRASIITSACQWWQSICQKSSLSKIAVAILTLPATSAATERSFSTQGWIHSSKRNKLSIDRAGKITYIARNLKLLNPSPKNTEEEWEEDEESNKGEDEISEICAEHEEVEFLEEEFTQD